MVVSKGDVRCGYPVDAKYSQDGTHRVGWILTDSNIILQEALRYFFHIFSLLMEILSRAFVFFICLIALFSIALSQTSSIVGRIYDSETKKPISGARITIENSERGTYSTGSGFFRISQISKDQTIIISSLGYKSKSLTLKHFEGDTLFVFLEATPIPFAEIEKIADIDVDEIIRRAIRKKKENLSLLETLQARIYSKFFAELDSTSLTQVSINPSTFKTSREEREDSLKKEYVQNFILENFANVYVDYKNNFKYQEVTERRQTANLPKEINTLVFSDFLSFYEDILEVFDAKFIAPLNESAFDFYEYKLKGKTLYNDRFIYEIEFTPKTRAFPTFEGEMKIIEGSYNLLEIDVKPSRYSAITMFDKFRMIQKFNQIGENFWQPSYWKIESRLKVSVVKRLFEILLNFRAESIVTNALINQPIPDTILKKFKNQTTDVLPQADSTDLSFWEQNALSETSKEEQSIYLRIDSLAKVVKPIVEQREKLDYGINFLDGSQYNRVGGYVLGFTPYIRFKPFRLDITPSYSFGRREFFYNARLEWEYSTQTKLIFNVFSDLGTITQDKNMPLALASALAYIFHWDYYDYCKKRGARLELRIETQSGTSLFKGINLAFENSKYYSLDNRVDRSLFTKKSWRQNPNIAEGNFSVFSLNLTTGNLPKFSEINLTDEFQYSGEINAIIGTSINNRSFALIQPKITLKIPTFFTGYRPMMLIARFEGGITTKFTPQQFIFRMPNAFGLGNFYTATTGYFGGNKYLACHLQYNLADILWRLVGLPLYEGRGLELLLSSSHGRFWCWGENCIYRPTGKKLYSEIGFGFSRIPTFISNLVFLEIEVRYNISEHSENLWGGSLNLSLPF
ncbi:MAG: DUF5686 and carboxypeptidase regulatory-like domain-containing protein [Ignavibacteria bacterium]|nr:DUF5686 and carboxypeptidase regulatory-like domain-containing protein [Ignavibacteria bacterium]